jgi:MoaA/NifB/PqqE/SkfB family radical SAM enzyme
MDSFYRLLKVNRLVRSHRIKFAALLAMHHLHQRYLCLRFDPVMSCNLRCQMCYFSDPAFTKEHLGRFSWEQIERLAEVLFPRTLQMYLGCGTEPTTYKRWIDILVLAKKYRVPMIGMVSNGHLLTREKIEKLIEVGLHELTLSTHGVRKETYELMMRRASFDKFLEVLETVDSVKRKGGYHLPQLRLNYTVNPDNLEELSRFFDVYGRYGISTLQVRPIIDFGHTEYEKKDMRPYQETYLRILEALRGECQRRGIRLLANTDDISYTKKSTIPTLADEVTVYINPEEISKKGFDWQRESYERYCRRTGWSRKIVRYVLSSADQLATASTHLSYQVLD